jgi:hypothetical protein
MAAEMDPAVAAAFQLSALRESNEVGLRIGRQSDGAQLDNRVYAAFIATQLFVSDDPMQIAGGNLAARSPTTLEHPQYYPSALQGSPIKV